MLDPEEADILLDEASQMFFACPNEPEKKQVTRPRKQVESNQDTRIRALILNYSLVTITEQNETNSEMLPGPGVYEFQSLQEVKSNLETEFDEEDMYQKFQDNLKMLILTKYFNFSKDKILEKAIFRDAFLDLSEKIVKNVEKHRSFLKIDNIDEIKSKFDANVVFTRDCKIQVSEAHNAILVKCECGIDLRGDRRILKMQYRFESEDGFWVTQAKMEEDQKIDILEILK